MNEQKWRHLSVAELYQHRDEWQLVDIRDQNTFQQGHIPSATHLTNENLQQYIDEHDFEQPLVVICYVGNSSKAAAELLVNAGFDEVYSLDGGMISWSKQFPDMIHTA